ncbi:MAG: hypothetical protein EA360_10925 [Balneolaceae bacterium]|nr:MAG: hypothetical protein EA360_10925 [Balneolaceae bacterium]
MKIYRFILPLFLFFTLTSSLVLTGCGSDHDHGPTPVGIVLSAGGTDLAIQEGTTITYPTGAADAIEIQTEETVSPVTVTFLMEDGERFTPDVNDGYSLRFSASNSSVISVVHPLTNQWTFSLEGVQAGESAVNFQLWHVGHSDFESRDFTIRVVTPATQ